MDGFVYYIPGESKPMPKPALRGLGIPVLCDATDAELTQCPCTQGPRDDAGQAPAGVLAWLNGAAGKVWHLKDVRSWARIGTEHSGAQREYWIGWADLPRPEALARKQLIAGEDVLIGERAWTVPQTKLFPLVYGWENGPALTMAPQYRDVFNALQQYMDVWLGIDKEKDVFWAMDLAARVLGLNYYVSKIELAQLRVMDTQACLRVLYAALDLHRLLEAVKKNEASPLSDAPANNG